MRVDWNDSKSLMGWTYSPLKQREPGKIRSLGYVVQLNSEALTITTSMDKLVGASIDDFIIPLGCITEVVVLPKDWNVKEGK